VSGCTVFLEGSDDGQQFVTLTSTSSPENMGQVYLRRSANLGTTERLYTFLRWRVSGSGNYYATFRVRVVLTAGDGVKRSVALTRANGVSQGCGAGGGGGDQAVLFEPWLCLHGAGAAAGALEYPIQPIGRWLDTSNMPTYHVLQTITDFSNVNLILETAAFPEEVSDHWNTVRSTAGAGEWQIPVSNEFAYSSGASAPAYPAGGGYLRWRVQPVTIANDWYICFQLKVVPGASAQGRTVAPRCG
jgi:hypothetical protein